MQSAAAAIAWEFRQRHRWGLIALTGYLIILPFIKLVILARGLPINLDDAESFALVVMVPLTSTFTYFLAMFSYGLAGDLAARESMYPARMFTLPVTNAALAGWPMLYGTAAMAMLWLVTRFFALWPSGVQVPLIWPALLAAVLLAWTQALTWMPYGLRGLRVIVAVLWLAVIDTVVLVALYFKASEAVMLAFLAPQLPLAYLAARFAVARARRGDVPDWRQTFSRLGQIADVLPRRRNRFSLPVRAQLWFEWRRHGRSLPALVAILLPFELGLLFLAGGTRAFVFYILIGVLLTPIFMAAFAAATVSKTSESDAYGVSPFMATRPLTSASLIAAKLTMTIWSTLATWLLVLVTVPLALKLSGTWTVVIETARHGVEAAGTARATVIALLVLAGLVVATWKQLVQSLYIGMSGREWVVKASVFLTLSILFILGPVANWIIENGNVQAVLWDALPWLPAVLVCLKMSAGVWIVTRLYRSGLLSDRTLVIAAGGWCVAVLALYGVLVWLVATPWIARYWLALIAILAIPLTRLSMAPLALARNRHR